MPNPRAFRSSVWTCTRESWSRICSAVVEPSVGTLWSAVARVRSGRRNRAAGQSERLERLGGGDLVDEMEVDVEERIGHLVGLPDLVEQSLRHQLLLRPAATTA
jgi:hypothetical protein